MPYSPSMYTTIWHMAERAGPVLAQLCRDGALSPVSHSHVGGYMIDRGYVADLVSTKYILYGATLLPLREYLATRAISYFAADVQNISFFSLLRELGGLRSDISDEIWRILE